MTLQERFDKKWITIGSGGCWIWVGASWTNGYGEIEAHGKHHQFAHRISYELHVGPIPDGLCVLHTCDYPGCVNPKHLWLGTHADNMADMARKGRCPTKKGEANPFAKLTDIQVVEIRRLLGTMRDYEIAKIYNVSPTHIGRIKLGKCRV